MNAVVADAIEAGHRPQQPNPIPPAPPPGDPRPDRGVSFGFRHLNPITPAGTLDLAGITYDAAKGINLGTDGRPAIFSPNLASTTQYTTTADHQSWTDNDSD